jgi:hypothetical protein
LEKFLKSELFMGDFMSVGKVSDVTHALLYKFARMTIHPSTFEGNLPLPFAESVSLGTPCIMPYSTAYLDYVDPSMHPWIFYNPTQIGLIEKVEEVESRRPEFIRAQREVVKMLRRNTLAHFFDLHMQAFGKAQRIEPKCARYFIDGPKAKPKPADAIGFRRFLRLPLRRPARGAPEIQMKRSFGLPRQTRIWPQFTFSTAGQGRNVDEPVLHWAAYLGDEHPKGSSYFTVSIQGGSQPLDPNDLQLTAEVGTWINDEYVAAETRPLRFGNTGQLPSELINAFQFGSGGQLPDSASIHLGWAKLSWLQGAVPEIRISGPALPRDSAISARVACLTDPDGSSLEFGCETGLLTHA